MRQNLKILFLCTGNSCRSQMAEGWAKKLSRHLTPWSAGVEKHGLDPYAVKVMAEVGVDISSHYSKLIDEVEEHDFDYVITVCDSAKEKCPYFPGDNKAIHRSFADPPTISKNSESSDDILKIYRTVRDEIKDFILGMPMNLTENKGIQR